MKYLEKSCRKHEVWHSEHEWRYPKVQYKHITKYKAEQKINLVDHKERDIWLRYATLWPLLAFPDRENVAWKKFEHRMAADKSRGASGL